MTSTPPTPTLPPYFHVYPGDLIAWPSRHNPVVWGVVYTVMPDGYHDWYAYVLTPDEAEHVITSENHPNPDVLHRP